MNLTSLQLIKKLHYIIIMYKINSIFSKKIGKEKI